MVLKNAFAAAICAGLLTAGPASAAEYRAGEFLGMDLSTALLSPKRIGPETTFAPVAIEAKSDSAQAEAAASVWPKLRRSRPQVARAAAEPPRAKLARRSNPLDAQARDTRIQTWPCKSGGICAWQR